MLIGLTLETHLPLGLGHETEQDEHCHGDQVENEGSEQGNLGEGGRQRSHNQQEDCARCQDGRGHQRRLKDNQRIIH